MAVAVNSAESSVGKPFAFRKARAAWAEGPPVWLRMPNRLSLDTELPMKFLTFFWNAANDT